MAETFALVEPGTSRAWLFLDNGTSVLRTLDGTWVSRPRTADDVISAEDLIDFEAASDMALSALVQEASAASLETPSRSSDA